MTKYNQSFKQDVIEFYLQNGKNRSLTCHHFQLNETTLRHWINQYNHNGINRLLVCHNKQVYSFALKLTALNGKVTWACISGSLIKAVTGVPNVN